MSRFHERWACSVDWMNSGTSELRGMAEMPLPSKRLTAVYDGSCRDRLPTEAGPSHFRTVHPLQILDRILRPQQRRRLR